MNPPVPPSASPAGSDPVRAWISAFADGDASCADTVCRQWRDDGEARATWHAYHLIGDVLRSDELASAPARDAAFLAALRTRLASEPVPLSPKGARTTAHAPRRQAWLVPAAAAAGFAAVAGVMLVARGDLGGVPGAAIPAVAITPARPEARQAALIAVPAPAAPASFVGFLPRDPQIDRYLRAHRSAFAAGAIAVPVAAPRNAEMLMPAELPQPVSVAR